MEVVRLNWYVEDSGWYEWMLMRWSSEPEANRRPDVDQLERSVHHTGDCRSRKVPESIDASIVAFQLVHDVHVLRPLSVAVQAKYAGIPLVAAGGDLALQQAVVYTVFHGEGSLVDARRRRFGSACLVPFAAGGRGSRRK